MTRNSKFKLSSVLSFKSSSGFTLVELLLVIAISVILGVVATISYLGLRNKQALDNSVQRVVEDLRTVSSQPLAGQGDKQWGVRFTNSTIDYYEVWNGASYGANPVVSKSTLGGGVSFSDPAEG